MILDTFAGGGGWDMAARSLGLPDPIGIELDASACALRAATGLLTIRADVSTYPLDHLPEVTGLIASPPCQDFSTAGKRDGLAGATGMLVYEPLRWAKALRPEWIACEQVKEVLPIWRQTADELRTMGYSAWCGVLDAANFGIVEPCPLHSVDWPTNGVEVAERNSRCGTALACAEVSVTTKPNAVALKNAVSAVGHWATEIRRVCAGGATCAERRLLLEALVAQEVPTILHGRAGAGETNAGTYGCGWITENVANIESWLNRRWGVLYSEGKLSITWTDLPTTTIHRILKCIAATVITGPCTGTESRSVGCGLCVDVATPQHRRRAILMASRVRQVQPPPPTHGKGGSDDLCGYGVKPLVTMEDGLGWGLTERPATTVMSRGPGGGVRGLDGGSGTRALYRREKDAGRWTLRTPGRSYDAPPRRAELTEPAPTVALGHNASSWYWESPDTECPVEMFELGVLQDFPFDHPWEAAGTKEAQSRAIGNAIPVRLAKAILGALTGQAREAVA